MSDTAPRTVVHIHGAGDCAAVWSSVSEFLTAANVPTVFLDLPMHGSNTDSQPDTVEGYADWVEQRLENASLTDVVLSGHSMGALIAMEVAARGNERISRLVLEAVGSRIRVSEDLLRDAVHDTDAACSFMDTWSSSRASKVRVAEALAEHDNHRRSLESGVLANDLHACNNYLRAVDAAAAVDVPTIVVLAGRDKMVPPETAGPVIDALTTVERIDIEGVGHALQHEAPDRVGAVLVAEALDR